MKLIFSFFLARSENELFRYKRRFTMGDKDGEGGRENSHGHSPSKSPSRTPSPHNSKASREENDDDLRSRSRSREKRSRSRRKSHRSRSGRRGRHHKSRRSRSDSRSSESSTKVKMLINHQLATTLGDVLRPIQEQLSKLNGDAPESSTISTEMKDLRLEQQRLLIETKAASLSSPGGQSQY